MVLRPPSSRGVLAGGKEEELSGPLHKGTHAACDLIIPVSPSPLQGSPFALGVRIQHVKFGGTHAFRPSQTQSLKIVLFQWMMVRY